MSQCEKEPQFASVIGDQRDRPRPLFINHFIRNISIGPENFYLQELEF